MSDCEKEVHHYPDRAHHSSDDGFLRGVVLKIDVPARDRACGHWIRVWIRLDSWYLVCLCHVPPMALRRRRLDAGLRLR